MAASAAAMETTGSVPQTNPRSDLPSEALIPVWAHIAVSAGSAPRPRGMETWTSQ